MGSEMVVVLFILFYLFFCCYSGAKAQLQFWIKPFKLAVRTSLIFRV